MHSIILAISVVGAIATSFVSYFLLAIISKWRKTLWLKQHGIEADAQILEAEVINEDGRYLPFVRLKVEVMNSDREDFITTFDSLFSFPQLPELVAGNTIRVKFNPENKNHVVLIKQQPVKTKGDVQQWSSAKAPQLSLAS